MNRGKSTMIGKFYGMSGNIVKISKFIKKCDDRVKDKFTLISSSGHGKIPQIVEFFSKITGGFRSPLTPCRGYAQDHCGSSLDSTHLGKLSKCNATIG